LFSWDFSFGLFLWFFVLTKQRLLIIVCYCYKSSISTNDFKVFQSLKIICSNFSDENGCKIRQI